MTDVHRTIKDRTDALRDVDGDQDTDNPTYTERVTGVWGD